LRFLRESRSPGFKLFAPTLTGLPGHAPCRCEFDRALRGERLDQYPGLLNILGRFGLVRPFHGNDKLMNSETLGARDCYWNATSE
jgi:hypothetical protein